MSPEELFLSASNERSRSYRDTNQHPSLPCNFRKRLFAYSRKLPAYSGTFLLTIESFSLFYLQLELFCLQWESASNKGLKGL